MMNDAEIKLKWLHQAMEITGLKASPLAKQADVSPGTLLRFLNDPENVTPPRDRTLNAIARAHGLTPFNQPEEKLLPVGFSEDGAKPLTPKDVGGEEQFLALKKASANADDDRFWVMDGRGLENIGILAGDVLVVDYHRSPKVNDVVCISLRDEEKAKARTIFRHYAADSPVPVCVTASNDHRINLEDRIIFIDGIKAKIYGVVSMSLRHY